MKSIALRLVLNALCLWLTVSLVNGVDYHGADLIDYIFAGIVFALLNLLIKPIVFLFPFPALLLTLGLFYLVINALILWMLDLFIPLFWVGGFWAAFKGALSFSVLNWLMSWLLNDE